MTWRCYANVVAAPGGGAAGLVLAAALSGCAVLSGQQTHVPQGLAAALPAAAGRPDRSEEMADAVPRIEPLHPSANWPYEAGGRLYRPFTDDRPFKERGRAAVLGAAYDGKLTASGEPFAAQSMSAAHPTLPIPSYARVTNLRNGHSAIVRIVDRGAFNRGEAIALSAAAAQKLQLAGNDQVEVERLTTQMVAAIAPPAALTPLPAEPVQLLQTAAEVGPAAPAPAAAEAVPLPPLAELSPPAAAASTVSPTAPPPPVAAATGRPVPARPVAAGAPYRVQLAAFVVEAVAQSVRARVAEQLVQAGAGLPAPRLERRGNRFVVLVGDFAERAAAEAAAARLRAILRQDVVIEPRR
ncbi:MAG: RlpA-like double-psi beta-barrel domain-containing protein [Sutterellaceae bacterium]|nr:SPOR domain-containing protein [Burkholderiaceae bacterium]MCX7900991.1 SPOR domain-containing protein [Burkholderiaceae bacterium]MDW8430156.1 RlpA-like double-psi beta-barrel domain-containing protein [Sutterellaceae bacterium]